MGLELQINRATRSLISRALNYSSSFTFRSTQQKLDSHSKVFLKYLKLLDALRSIQTKRGSLKLANQSDEDEETFRDNNKKALKKAEYIRDAGYIDIALMQEI
ncbi:MAG: hypothetical protein B7Y28_23865 [Polaromonas sp. 16-63-31]|nr:MAG: hypothetical protein B7Y28_23865 [Polaromonas sp. 16-63-31]